MTYSEIFKLFNSIGSGETGISNNSIDKHKYFIDFINSKTIDTIKWIIENGSKGIDNLYIDYVINQHINYTKKEC